MIKIGKHTVNNQPVEEVDFKYILQGKKAYALYTDFPWGDGNIKYWATMNKKNNNVENKPLTYTELLDVHYDLIKNHVDGYVFMETGLRWKDETIDKFKPLLHNMQVFRLLYRSGNRMLPNLIIVGSTSSKYPPFSKDITDMSGLKLVKTCVDAIAKPDKIGIDMCCGMGYSAQAFKDAGMVFVGNELNKTRLDKTIKRLQK